MTAHSLSRSPIPNKPQSMFGARILFFGLRSCKKMDAPFGRVGGSACKSGECLGLNRLNRLSDPRAKRVPENPLVPDWLESARTMLALEICNFGAWLAVA